MCPDPLEGTKKEVMNVDYNLCAQRIMVKTT